MKKTLTVLMATLMLISMAGCKKTVDFEEEFSNYDGKPWCEIASDGSYIKIDTNPYNMEDSFDGDAWNAIQDINNTLDFPQSLEENMSSTRSMDGRQTDDNDEYKVSWTYHPDNGLEVMYEKK